MTTLKFARHAIKHQFRKSVRFLRRRRKLRHYPSTRAVEKSAGLGFVNLARDDGGRPYELSTIPPRRPGQGPR
jgi:hypothetical protein